MLVNRHFTKLDQLFRSHCRLDASYCYDSITRVFIGLNQFNTNYIIYGMTKYSYIQSFIQCFSCVFCSKLNFQFNILLIFIILQMNQIIKLHILPIKNSCDIRELTQTQNFNPLSWERELSSIVKRFKYHLKCKTFSTKFSNSQHMIINCLTLLLANLRALLSF